ncbi:11482_t:CDS:2, partial [Acaulospora morrowiae]
SENRFAKLEQRQTQVITNEQEVSLAKNISPPIEDQSDKDNGITLDPLSEHNSTQTQWSNSKSLTDPESSIASLPQDIIDDDSAETLDFVERGYKERVSKEKMERIREKKLRDQNLSSDNSSSDQSNLSCDISREHKITNQNLRISIKDKVSLSRAKLSTDQAQSDIPELSNIPSQIAEASTLVVKIPYNRKVEQELDAKISSYESQKLIGVKNSSRAYGQSKSDIEIKACEETLLETE